MSFHKEEIASQQIPLHLQLLRPSQCQEQASWRTQRSHETPGARPPTAAGQASFTLRETRGQNENSELAIMNCGVLTQTDGGRSQWEDGRAGLALAKQN